MLQSFNPNEMYRYTALGRVLNPMLYRTNLYIMVATLLAGVMAGLVTLLHSGDLWAAVQAGFYTAAAVFLAWVFTRDFDPDHNASAFVAAAVTLVVAPSALAVLSLAFIATQLRVISRIVGPVPQVWEYGGVLVLLAVASVMDGGWIAIAALAGFLMDASLPNATRLAWLGVVGSVILAAVGFVLNNPVFALPSALYLVVGSAVVGSFAALIAYSNKFTTATDSPNHVLYPQRIQATMAFVLVMAVVSMAGGDSLMRAYAPVWAAMTGAVVWRAWLLLRR